MKKSEIAKFYDDYTERQIQIGANERLINLYKRLIHLGLKKDSNVLELGCGVGIFTKLLAKKISNGKIEAIDLSEKSIAIAERILKNKKNISFKVADIVKYQPKNKEFDFITLMDVIEHIPLEQHDELFENLAKISTIKTRIAINIPNPQYINYTRVNNPESLQVIDEEVELFQLIRHLEKHHLELIYFEKYGIWEEEDYHFMIIRKKKKFELKHLATKRKISEKIVKKVSLSIDKFRYK
ncbi:class I SAM-dependent methyltransferase [Chryseobacterium sp. SIMBA_029]|uniref:class I SAM-dependent methyltransferase n=1 Tax=Chryseobacterium sp. SIMBA_029 TaxID=3085772 RepID=UPI0039782760